MNKESIPSYVPKSAYLAPNFIGRATLPTGSSADGETLEYGSDLHTEVKKVFDEAYWHFFEDAASNEFEKQKIKEQEDKIYLTLLAYQTNDPERSASERQNWADAFTDLGIKIYGKPDAEMVEKEAYTHANRIYRGTPGNDEVYGIFTKDAIYFTGFVLATNYIEDRLIKGDKIDDIMHFIEAGKFDPTNPDQSKYVEEKLANNLDFND